MIYRSLLGGTAGALMSVSIAFGAGSGLPGDIGRPMNGLMMPSNNQATPAPQPVPHAPTGADVSGRPPAGPPARAPSIRLALEAVKAISAGCKKYPLGIAVVNSVGAPILFYIPDGSQAWHSYSALRKAYTAILFKADSSQVMLKSRQDTALADQIRADPNLQAFSGALLLKAGNDIIGAIAVSGAEPGGHDEECARIGVAKVKKRLK
jgi:uncharacterized protein GlcG (DUF336 family)